MAQSQLEGALSKKIRGLRDQITAILAQLEVAIDYPEEDIEFITYKELVDQTTERGPEDCHIGQAKCR